MKKEKKKNIYIYIYIYSIYITRVLTFIPDHYLVLQLVLRGGMFYESASASP